MNAWRGTDPSRLMTNWTRLIQLAIGRVGYGSSNSPNGELNWLIQLALWRVGCGSSNSPNGEFDVAYPM